MIRYFDTSALVKKYVSEKGSARVVELLKSSAAPVTSILAYPELIAGIGRKRRHAEIAQKDYASALAAFEKDWAALFVVEFQQALLPIQKRLSSRHSLKGADLVHLSSLLWLRESAREDVTLIASDVQLLHAAEREDVECVNPEEA